MQTNSTRNIVIKIVAVTLPFLLFICVMEILLRFLGPEYYKFNNRSSEYYSNPRGYHLPLRQEGSNIIYGLHYMESWEGFRLPDHESGPIDTQEPDMPGILVVGDSFTYGRGVKYEDIYTTRLAKMLKDSGYRAHVKNCGIVGADVENVTKVLSYEMSKKTYPLVVYGFVLNDFGLSLSIKGSDFIDVNNGGNHWSALRDFSKIVNLVMFCIERYRLSQETTKAYLDAFNGENAERGFQSIADMNRNIKLNGGKLIIMLFPLLYKFDHYPFMEIHRKIAAQCAKENIPLIDLLPVYSSYKDKDLWANPTDQHPNEKAHKLAAESLYNVLVEQKYVTR